MPYDPGLARLSQEQCLALFAATSFGAEHYVGVSCDLVTGRRLHAVGAGRE